MGSGSQGILLAKFCSLATPFTAFSKHSVLSRTLSGNYFHLNAVIISAASLMISFMPPLISWSLSSLIRCIFSMFGLCVKDEEDDFARRPTLCHCPELQNKAVKMLKDALQLKVSEMFFKYTICIWFYCHCWNTFCIFGNKPLDSHWELS